MLLALVIVLGISASALTLRRAIRLRRRPLEERSAADWARWQADEHRWRWQLQRCFDEGIEPHVGISPAHGRPTLGALEISQRARRR
jgi:hypothetical protein